MDLGWYAEVWEERLTKRQIGCNFWVHEGVILIVVIVLRGYTFVKTTKLSTLIFAVSMSIIL